MIDLTTVFKAFIYLLFALASAFLIPWLKSRTTADQRDTFFKWVDIAVAAAQQLYHKNSGQDRLEYALSILYEKGYDVETNEVRSAVEAAVLKLHKQLEGDANDG